MMKFENIIDLIGRCKTPYIRICDMNGNKIISIENKLITATIKELQDLEEMLSCYGKLEVSGATEENFKSNYKGCYKWYLVFDKVAKNQIGQMPGMNGINWGTAPSGFVHQDVMMAKLETLKQEMAFEKRFAELEKKINGESDPVEKYMGYAPMIMSALGHSDDKVEKMIKWYALSKGTKGMAFVPPVNTLTFKDVEKMSGEEKNAKIQALLDSLSTKVSAEHMILLLEAIDKKPELAEKAVNLLPML